MRYIKIHPKDNVIVALSPLEQGAIIKNGEAEIVLREPIPQGHKGAIRDITQGEDIIKYGYPIGRSLKDIARGTHVHIHNVISNLEGIEEYHYSPAPLVPGIRPPDGRTFWGYVRKNGSVGIRNEIWIIPTVGCVNGIAGTVCRLAMERTEGFRKGAFDGVHFFPHPYGCSQLGEDHLNTRRILGALVCNPNAGGVLVLGLGCENNNIEQFKASLTGYDPQRVRFLAAQEAEDEIETALGLVEELASLCEKDTRTEVPAARLRVGLKCGGSDGLSGITANPLIGAFSDMLITAGGTTVLTEIPEMFGAEPVMLNRCADQDVFNKLASLINEFKAYYKRYGQPIYENPSPGNRKGGISTLEDKSLGCVQKGGQSRVVDVLRYGERLRLPGLNVLEGPGNDLVAVSALAAAQTQLILFSTGRGTPLGAPVPVLKLATNSALARRKQGWIDFDVGALITGAGMEELAGALFNLVLKTASGLKTKNEINGYRDMAIFKKGVTL